VARGERIPQSLYKLDPGQVTAVKEFLKAGKPVLAAFGPVNEPANPREPPDLAPDGLEALFTELGFHLSRQTVLFNAESKAFAERRSGLLVLGANVEIPPVKFDWEPGAGLPSGRPPAEEGKPNPIRESLRLMARSVGKNQALDLRVRHPRPVYYDAGKGKKLPFEPEFMMSDEKSWNEDQPYPTPQRTPRYEPGAADFGKGSLDEKRRGPFPIGVAVETTLPASWYADNKDAKPATVRVAALGHGGIFLGNSLSPAREKLLLDTCNWLLGRDDLLTKADHVWQYPRVLLSSSRNSLWQWGTRLGLPVLFVYLGLVVLLVRRLR
jgi:hypothetical protein